MISVYGGILSRGKVEIVEVQVAVYKRAFPQLVITGLPSSAVRESKERLLTIFRECGVRLPRGRYVIHLQPATLKKEGTWLDMAIWLGLYLSVTQWKGLPTEKYFALGELGLDGKCVAPPHSDLIIKTALDNFTDIPMRFVIPYPLVGSIQGHQQRLYPIRKIQECVGAIQPWTLEEYTAPTVTQKKKVPSSKIKKTLLFPAELLEVSLLCLVGGHSLLLFGSPGQGKSFLRHALAQFIGDSGKGKVIFLPHTVTKKELINHDISSNSSVCILDEFPLWPKNLREHIRGWLEIGQGTTSLSPSIIVTANPCPCGFYGSDACRCTDYERHRHIRKFSGPLLDRLCMQVRFGGEQLTEYSSPEIAQIKQKIMDARKRQVERSEQLCWPPNSQQYSLVQMQNCATLPKKMAQVVSGWSIRRQTHLWQVAFSSCDLEGKSNVPQERHFWKAFEYVQPSIEWI